MFQNIIFLGGIHGAGKGRLCSKVKDVLDIEHLSASELLRWTEVNADPKNKLVADIPSMQDRLILGLHHRVEPNRKYLLDGHFCLFDGNGKVKHIPFETFSKIDPILISVLTAEQEAIVQRLTQRESKAYDLQLIRQMQEEEITYGKWVAGKLSKPFLVMEGEEQVLIDAINTI